MANVYLDHAATTFPDPGVLAFSAETASTFFANPSSLHADGRSAARALSEARERTARALGTSAERIVFTSGGTESNAIALQSVLRKRGGGHIIISGVEHPSVYEATRTLSRLGFELSVLDAETDGRVAPDRIEAAFRDTTILVAVMAVNNETGAIQPIREIAEAAGRFAASRGRKIHVHCDAVQALGKITFAPDGLGVDTASFSSHKIHGPRGAGFLYVRKTFEVLGSGGGQERGLRSGTENLPGIVGTSLAVEKAAAGLAAHAETVKSLRDRLIAGLQRIPGAVFVPGSILDRPELYSPYIVSVSFPPVPGEVLVRVLSDRGFSVSTGSACSSGKNRRVLTAMGVDEHISFSSIRVSLDASVKPTDIDAFCDVLDRERAFLLKPLKSGTRE